MAKNYGKKTWLIADAYLQSVSKNENLSHEAVCVVNTTDTDAVLKFTLYFEDRPACFDFESFCGAKMTHHVRLDKIRSKDGKSIPHDTPYAILVESNTEIVVQYSRLDTSAGGMALMTTIAYPVED